LQQEFSCHLPSHKKTTFETIQLYISVNVILQFDISSGGPVGIQPFEKFDKQLLIAHVKKRPIRGIARIFHEGEKSEQETLNNDIPHVFHVELSPSNLCFLWGNPVWARRAPPRLFFPGTRHRLDYENKTINQFNDLETHRVLSLNGYRVNAATEHGAPEKPCRIQSI